MLKWVSDEDIEKAMLRNKTKFVKNMDRFSSRKNAYKTGWKDCINWMRDKLTKQ
jgi:hypothetical protein